MAYHKLSSGGVFSHNGKSAQIIGVNMPEGCGYVIHPDGRIEIVEDVDKLTSNVDAKPYKPEHSRELSLWRVNSQSKAVAIAFSGQLQFPIDFEKLKATGQFRLADWIFPIYHGAIVWSYTLSIDRSDQKTKAGGPKYRISFVSLGSHLEAGGKDGNDLPGVNAPPVTLSTLFIDTSEDVEKYALVARPDGSLLCEVHFCEKGLRRLLSDDGTLHVHPLLGVPATYFNLGKMIDLLYDLKAPTVPVSELAMVAKILRGEQPAGADWKITGSHRCSGCNNCAPVPVYHVHRARFVARCPTFESAPSTTAGCTKLEGLTDHGLRMAILSAYGMAVPLPDRLSYSKELIADLHKLFGDRFRSVVVPQWERTICRQALAMDAKKPSSSMAALLHLLNVIWSAPYGWMPVAKRIAIGVLADMAHHGTRSSVEQWVQDEVQPHVQASNCEATHVSGIVSALYKVMLTAPGVTKYPLAELYGGRVDEEEKGHKKSNDCEKNLLKKAMANCPIS